MHRYTVYAPIFCIMMLIIILSFSSVHPHASAVRRADVHGRGLPPRDAVRGQGGSALDASQAPAGPCLPAACAPQEGPSIHHHTGGDTSDTFIPNGLWMKSGRRTTIYHSDKGKKPDGTIDFILGCILDCLRESLRSYSFLCVIYA